MREIAAQLGASDCYFTNLVKCLPLSANGKIRYPTQRELEVCFHNYSKELKTLSPEKVILLGRQVSQFVAAQLQLDLRPIGAGEGFGCGYGAGIEFLSAHHPSYVLVYRRRGVEDYKRQILAFAQTSDVDHRCEAAKATGARLRPAPNLAFA